MAIDINKENKDYINAQVKELRELNSSLQYTVLPGESLSDVRVTQQVRNARNEFGSGNAFGANEEYGPLRAMLTDTLANSLNLPTAMQDRMGIEVYNAMRGGYSGYIKNLPDSHPMKNANMPFSQFMEFGEQSHRAELLASVKNKKVSSSWRQFFGTNIYDPINNVTSSVSDFFSDVGNPQTIGDITNAVGRSFLPGIVHGAVNMFNNSGSDIASTITSMTAGAMNAIASYVPWIKTEANGQFVRNGNRNPTVRSLLQHAQSSALYQATTDRRAEMDLEANPLDDNIIFNDTSSLPVDFETTREAALGKLNSFNGHVANPDKAARLKAMILARNPGMNDIEALELANHISGLNPEEMNTVASMLTSGQVVDFSGIGKTKGRRVVEHTKQAPFAWMRKTQEIMRGSEWSSITVNGKQFKNTGGFTVPIDKYVSFKDAVENRITYQNGNIKKLYDKPGEGLHQAYVHPDDIPNIIQQYQDISNEIAELTRANLPISENLRDHQLRAKDAIQAVRMANKHLTAGGSTFDVNSGMTIELFDQLEAERQTVVTPVARVNHSVNETSGLKDLSNVLVMGEKPARNGVVPHENVAQIRRQFKTLANKKAIEEVTARYSPEDLIAAKKSGDFDRQVAEARQDIYGRLNESYQTSKAPMLPSNDQAELSNLDMSLYEVIGENLDDEKPDYQEREIYTDDTLVAAEQTANYNAIAGEFAPGGEERREFQTSFTQAVFDNIRGEHGKVSAGEHAASLTVYPEFVGEQLHQASMNSIMGRKRKGALMPYRYNKNFNFNTVARDEDGRMIISKREQRRYARINPARPVVKPTVEASKSSEQLDAERATNPSGQSTNSRIEAATYSDPNLDPIISGVGNSGGSGRPPVLPPVASATPEPEPDGSNNPMFVDGKYHPLANLPNFEQYPNDDNLPKWSLQADVSRAQARHDLEIKEGYSLERPGYIKVGGGEQKSANKVYTVLEGRDGELWWANRDMVGRSTTANQIVSGNQTTDVFKVGGELDHPFGVVRDETGKIISHSRQVDLAEWQNVEANKQTKALLDARNKREVLEKRSSQQAISGSWLNKYEVYTPDREKIVNKHDFSRKAGEAIGFANIIEPWVANKNEAAKKIGSVASPAEFVPQINELVRELSSQTPSELTEMGFEEAVFKRFPELQARPDIVDKLKVAYAEHQYVQGDREGYHPQWTMQGFADGQNKATDGDWRRVGGLRRSLHSAAMGALSAKSVDKSKIVSFNRQAGVGEARRNPAGDGEIYNIRSHTSDNVVLDDVGIGAAHTTAQQTMIQATSMGDLPAGANSAYATVKKRISSILDGHVEDYMKSLKKAGFTETDANKYAEVFKQAAQEYLGGMMDHFEGQLNKQGFGQVNKTVANGAHFSNRNKYNTREGVAQLRQDKPELEKQFMEENNGMTFDQAASRPKGQEILWEDGNDGFYTFGGSGYGFVNNQRSNGGNKFWNGPAGGAFYGAYLMRRLWGMTAGPEIAAAERYTKGMAEVGVAGDGRGASAEASRLEMLQGSFDKGSYEVFGGFMGGGAAFADKSGSAPRMLSYAKFGAATAGIASIAPGMLAGMLPAAVTEGALGSLLTSSAIPTAGLYAGGLAIGSGLMLEGYNQFLKPKDEAPVTIGSLWKAGTTNLLAQQAVARGQFFGGNPTEFFKDIVSNTNAVSGIAGFGRKLFTGNDEVYDDNGFVKDQYRERLSNAQIALLESKDATPLEVATKDMGEALAYRTGEDPTEGKKVASTYVSMFGKAPSEKLNNQLANRANQNNVAAAEIFSEAAAYADSFGSAGSVRFEDAFNRYLNTDLSSNLASRTQAGKIAATNSGFAAQIQAYLPNTEQFSGVGKYLREAYNVNSQVDLASFGTVQSTFNHYLGDEKGAELSEYVLAATQHLSPYQLKAANAYAGNALAAGNGPWSTIADITGMRDLTPQQAIYEEAIQSRDIAGISWASYQPDSQNYGDTTFRAFDMAGRSINERSGSGTYDFMSRWQGNSNLSGVMSKLDFSSKNAFASSMLGGTQNQDLISAYLDNGTYGIQEYARQKSYEFSMAGAGIAAAGVELTRQFNWGSGTWDNPAAGSMWYMQDQQRAMQHQSTLAGFAATEWQMQSGQNYQIAQENIQASRMNITQGYNVWQSDFNRQAQLMQRGWAKEDWGYQDQSRSLSWGWSMEDIDEQIRFAKGRERRQLVRQKERMGITHNLEEGQIDESRDRQQEMWAMDDERYRKSAAYQQDLMELEREGFELNKEHREEMYEFETKEFERRKEEYAKNRELEEEMMKLQREHTAKQLDLQAASAGIQAAQAQLQKDIEDALKGNVETWDEFWGIFKNITTWDNARDMFLALNGLTDAVSGITVHSIDALTSLIKTAAQVGSRSVTQKIYVNGELQ